MVQDGRVHSEGSQMKSHTLVGHVRGPSRRRRAGAWTVAGGLDSHSSGGKRLSRRGNTRIDGEVFTTPGSSPRHAFERDFY